MLIDLVKVTCPSCGLSIKVDRSKPPKKCRDCLKPGLKVESGFETRPVEVETRTKSNNRGGYRKNAGRKKRIYPNR